MSMGGNPALKFVVDIKNEEKIEQLTKDINVQEAAIKKLAAQLRQGAIDEQKFIAAATPMGAAIAKATTEMKALQGASAMSGRGLLQLGYAVDDIQYGFSAIVNNIPQIVMGLGGSAGIAGAIGVVGVVISQLINHWGELSDIAQSNWSGGSVEQLKKIREAAEQAAEAFDKLTKEHTKAQEATAKFRHEAIVEGGVGRNLEGLAGGIAMEPGMRAEETPKQRLARRLVQFNPGQWRDDDPVERQLTEGKIRAELDEENRRKAREMMVAIEAGNPQAIATARRFARANPGAFSQGFRDKLDPEAAEDRRVKELNIQAQIQGNKNIREAEKKADEEKFRKNKELTEEGIRNEDFMKRKQLEDQKRDIQEQIRRGEHLLTPEGRRQLQDQMLGGKAPEASSIMSVKAFADKMLTAGMNSVPQKQLDTLVGMHNTLKDIDKKMRAQGLE